MGFSLFNGTLPTTLPSCHCCCWLVVLYVYLCGYLCVRGRRIVAIHGENVHAAWEAFSTLQQTPFHCKLQMSCNKKTLQWLIRCSRTGRNQRREESMYKERWYFETLIIIEVLLSLLAGALAGRCHILTSASQSGAVNRSEVTIPVAHSTEQRKENRNDGKWWRKRYEC